MAENLGSDHATREQLSYYQAVFNGRASYKTAQGDEVPIATLPAGVDKAPKPTRSVGRNDAYSQG